jgi:hypothetical protein
MKLENAIFWDVAPCISAATCSRWLIACGFLYPKDERRFTQDLHGATSQKTAFFIVAAVKTSDLALIMKLVE